MSEAMFGFSLVLPHVAARMRWMPRWRNIKPKARVVRGRLERRAFEVLIRDVRAMEIRSWFEGLELKEVDREYLRDFRSNLIEILDVGMKAYALLGKGWRGL
jgi:hypothetical protein